MKARPSVRIAAAYRLGRAIAADRRRWIGGENELVAETARQRRNVVTAPTPMMTSQRERRRVAAARFG
jgi:hypothetical protein